MYLLDTTALSEPLRRRPHPRFPRFIEELRRVPADALYTSSVCVMELRYGAPRKGDTNLWDRIHSEILEHVQILSFGKEEALMAGDLLAELQRTGQPIGIEDLQIAATALVADLTVVTASQLPHD